MLTLVVHPDADFRETLSKYLGEAGGEAGEIVVHPVTTEREALNNIRQQNQTRTPYDLLVTNFDLAENRKTSCLPGRGVKIIEFLPSHGHTGTNCVMLCPGGRLGKITLQPDHPAITFLDSQAATLFEDVIDIARGVLNRVAQKRTLSVVFMQDPLSHNWQFKLIDEHGNLVIPEGPLIIPEGVIQSLGSRSVELNTEALWLKGLAQIGQELQSIIFDINDAFRGGFYAAVEGAGGIEKARFAFKVTQDTHRVALEALCVPAQKPPVGFAVPEQKPEEVPFLMLKAPIYRTFSPASQPSLNRQSRKPLFEEDHGMINCLIIQADVSGEVTIPGSGVFTLKPLSNVLEECDWLERELNENRSAWGIGRVVRVAVSSLQAGQSFMQLLGKYAKEDEWQLVHYAGHSLYESPPQGSAGRGYFFLPGGRTGIEPLSAGVFSELLLTAQFLFLSSCHSSEENFVLEMVRHGVPAVVGFRWDIDDEQAAGYAKLFYKNLFEKQSIESAFVTARKEAREVYGAFERIWAAPMLMLHEPPVRAEAA